MSTGTASSVARSIASSSSTSAFHTPSLAELARSTSFFGDQPFGGALAEFAKSTSAFADQPFGNAFADLARSTSAFADQPFGNAFADLARSTSAFADQPFGGVFADLARSTSAFTFNVPTKGAPGERLATNSSLAVPPSVVAPPDIAALLRFELVEALEPALIAMWLGALSALTSNNPERMRHMAVSVRELMAHLVWRLAPDAVVYRWVNRPDYLHNNRPTRRARLHFVIAPTDPNLTKNQELAINDYIDLMDELHGHTHALSTRSSFRNAVDLLRRVRSAISGVLVLSRRS